ncbi:hypothetical protein J6O86_03325 [bacterium]|nr:hypothetical protein [bacterium]
MDCKKVSDTLPFKGLNIYNSTAYVQNHTLINRGITTLGGSTVPQCIMSNNKYEAQERALMGGIYFVASYLTPILLIPLYNKHFLKNKGIIKSLQGAEKKIIQVSKKYLTPDADLKEGLEKTAKIFDKKAGTNEHQKAFEEIYKIYNNPEKLKKDLLSVHEKVLMTDFITTGAMWSAIPWIATEYTQMRTKRKDFSAGFELKKDNSKSDEEFKKSKLKKLAWNIAFSVIPGILFAKTVTKGLSFSLKNPPLERGPKSLISRWGYKKIANNPQNFDYTSGTNMSKTIYAAIWVLSSFPAKLISSRDTNERKDRALRDIGLFTMFFGGDFLINNIAGRIADKIFGTKIMNDDGKKLNFLQKFKMPLRNFKTLDEVKDIPPEILKKTKNIGAGLYWFSLLTNTALIGFALPKVLNKFLRHNIEKEKEQELNKQTPAFKGKVTMEEFVKRL